MIPYKDIMYNDEPLYVSTRDEDGDILKPYKPVYADPVDVSIKPTVQPSVPVYEKQPDNAVLYTPQTIISTNIIPANIEVSTPEEQVRVDYERLIETYGGHEALNIIEDLKNNNPLPPAITEQLVTSGIVTENKVVKVLGQPGLNKNPIIKNEDDVKSVIYGEMAKEKMLKKTKFTLIDDITNFIYKLIYNK